MAELANQHEEALASDDCGVPTNWTVVIPGSVLPPKSSNYAEWTVEQLRKECTQRQLRLKRSIPVAERIAHIKNYDRMKENVERVVDPDEREPTGTRKSKHCCIRLLNVMFSDKFCKRIADLGDKASRQQLDTCDLHAESALWKDITAEFQANTLDYNNLWSDSDRFKGLDPSHVVMHNGSKLYDMWKQVNRNFVKPWRGLLNWVLMTTTSSHSVTDR